MPENDVIADKKQLESYRQKLIGIMCGIRAKTQLDAEDEINLQKCNHTLDIIHRLLQQVINPEIEKSQTT